MINERQIRKKTGQFVSKLSVKFDKMKLAILALVELLYTDSKNFPNSHTNHYNLGVQQIFAINIISKSQWVGKAPKIKTNSNNNLGYVVIHHSDGAYCCKQQMRSMQSYHMNDIGWADIGYNFGIGGDGNIYEGRGFGLVGAHATNWNSKALGIMFIGNYNSRFHN